MSETSPYDPATSRRGDTTSCGSAIEHRKHLWRAVTSDGDVLLCPGNLSTNPPLRAHARTSDPETSHAAAASVRGIRASHEAILKILKAHPEGITDERLAELYASARAVYPDLFPRQSASGIRTRRSELVTQARVVYTGRVVRVASGRSARTWKAR